MSMADELKAIDLIIKLLPFLKDLTGARRREFFEKSIQPLFVNLQDIHDFYVETIVQARNDLIDLKARASQTSILDPAISSQFEMIKNHFLNRRMKDESLRDSLRYEARDIFASIRWKEERRFVALVAYYFLGRGGIAPTAAELDLDIESVMEQGAVRKWDTPSIRTYLQIKGSSDVEEVLERLDDVRNSLNQAFMNARLAFKAVERAIVQQT